MSAENENIEPVTELGLSLSCSGHRSQRNLDSASGAGANAGTRIDMEFVATDPLSELVWSPQNGLSLKCADCSFGNKKPSFLWGTGPSNLLPSQNNKDGRSSTERPINEENSMMSRRAFHNMGEMASKDTSAETLESDAAIMQICGSNHEDRTDKLGSDNGISSGNPACGEMEVGRGNQNSRMEIVLASEPHLTKGCESNDSSMQNLTSPRRRLQKSASFLEKDSKNRKSIKNSLMDKLESTSENDLRNLISKNARGAASKIVASESAHEVKNSSRQDEQMLPKDDTVSDNYSPTNSRILRYQRKGKEKALADGNVNERMSKEDDDSHESVESCNSTRLFSTGKKRWSFEQQLIVGSKKIKTQIHESPGSTSFGKQDSSFMNWISNMMKGFSKSNEDEPPSLALTLAHSNQGHETHDQKLITYNKNHDYRCANVGFQSIFRSLYCPKMKAQDKTMDDDYQTDLELGNRLRNINATPIACHGDNDNQKFLLSNEKFNVTPSGNEASSTGQPKISSANFASSQENSKTNSAEKENSFNLGKGGVHSNSSTDKHKTSSTGKIVSEPASELKASHNFGHGSNPLGSLWITRFTPKNSFPVLNLECRNHSSDKQVLESSTNFSQNPVGSSNDLKVVDTGPQSTEDPPVPMVKEIQNFASETEISVGFNRAKGQNEKNLTHKLNLVLPSPRLRNSEPMASVFARRLDALKHSLPSDVTDNAGCTTITCFFCGKKGHHLRDCSEIKDGEIEDLVRNIDSYNGAEELSCLCIRCFQLNHWAVACPSATSRGHNLSQYGASLGNHLTPIERQVDKRMDRSTKLLDSYRSILQAAGTHSVCDHGDPKLETNLEIKWKLNEGTTFDRMQYKANPVRDCIASSCGENKFKDGQRLLFVNFPRRQISEVPKGIFNIIKTLRLSRTDILKWLNSDMSVELLNGFFLRLRLGKWEEGLGGTGYYVACITGAQRESSPKNSKNSIFVNVGGIKCVVVKSQYISNHDFLEDELMAWWSATTKSGGKIPSEEDLRHKLKERKMLGL